MIENVLNVKETTWKRHEFLIQNIPGTEASMKTTKRVKSHFVNHEYVHFKQSIISKVKYFHIFAYKTFFGLLFEQFGVFRSESMKNIHIHVQGHNAILQIYPKMSKRAGFPHPPQDWVVKFGMFIIPYNVQT